MTPTRLLWISLLLCEFAGLAAQEQPPRLRLGLGMAGFSYAGDMTYREEAPWRFLPGADFAIQFEGRKRIQPQIHAGFGRIAEQWDGAAPAADAAMVNAYFDTRFFYADLRLGGYLLRRGRVWPFVSAGGGFFSFTPRDESGNFLSENIFTRLEGETYNTVAFTTPLSLGGELRLTPLLALQMQYTYRFTSSDYLDNVGQLGGRRGSDVLHVLQLGMMLDLAAPVEPEPAKPPVQPSLPPLASGSRVEVEEVRAWSGLPEAAPAPAPSVRGAPQGGVPAWEAEEEGWVRILSTITPEALAAQRSLDPAALRAWNPGLPALLPPGLRVRVAPEER
jgi:hypothetical protein